MDDLIEQTINNSDIANDYDVKAGHCISVALAIQELFGGELIAISSTGKNIDHLAVQINNTLYDGRGSVTRKKLVNEYIGPRRSVKTNTRTVKPDDEEVSEYKGSRIYNEIIDRLSYAKKQIE